MHRDYFKWSDRLLRSIDLYVSTQRLSLYLPTFPCLLPVLNFLPIVLLQIRYDWVRDLLPRLHEVDSYSLSGWAEGKLTDNTRDGSLRDLDKHETGLHFHL